VSTPPFDPYHKWLGISPNDQPPHHYRLLGIDLFESDPDIIDLAASRQINHVRSLVLGDQPGLTQQLLNELAVARICLLNEARKAQYDSDLRSRIKVAASPVAAAVSDSTAAPIAQPVDQLANSSPTQSQAWAQQLRRWLERPFVSSMLLVFLLILIAAAGFFYPRVDARTGKGVVILKSNQPNPQLVIDGNDMNVE
jgi:hypothetical protein